MNGGGGIIFSHGCSNSRGVAIVFCNGSNTDLKDVYKDDRGRILVIEIMKAEKHFSLINIYAPNVEQAQSCFYTDLKQLLLERNLDEKDNIILCGDFNCVLNVNVDKKGGIEKPKECITNKMNHVIDLLDLTDIWRYKNPNEHRFTWRQRNPLIQCRLDYFLISHNLVDNVTRTEISPGIRTDHSAISLVISLHKDPVKGHGHWKFNNSYLNDVDYVTEMEQKLKVWTSEPTFEDVQVKWEFIKYKVRLFTNDFAKKKSKRKKDSMVELTSKLNHLEKKLANTPDQGTLEEIDKVKLDIEELDSKVVDGIIVRARIRWSEKGEKSNKYFLNMEKRNSKKKQCRRLVLEDGQVITNQSDISNLQRDFYKQIYESRLNHNNLEDNMFFKCKNIPTLNDEGKHLCEGDISRGEYFNALNKMPKNKSPGNDGLSSEWYLCFWNSIGTFLAMVLNTGLNKGEMSNSQRQAVITLIEKDGKDRCKLTNWRPISLLNVDYKIVSKALTSRLCKVISSIVIKMVL